MILKNKRDNESWIREKSLESMKANPYIELGDIISVAGRDYYQAVSSSTDIALQNNLYAQVINSEITGNISTATKLKTTRNIALTGDVTGNGNFDGTSNLTITTTVQNDSHNHSNSTITSLDASKITSGTIDIARLPKGALERLVKVQDDTARFALTTNSVQLGDTVHVVNTNKMYIVIDESKLNSESGYQIYVAGRAAEVPWSGVTNKPTTMPNPNPLTISLNGSSQGAYDGNTSKNINITPSSIGAAASSHGVHVTYGSINPKIASSSPSAGVSSDVSRADHVHLEQTNIAGNAGTATKLQTARTINGVGFDGSQNINVTANTPNSLTVQLNGTSQGAFNGSSAKTINITPASIGAEPSFSKNTAFNKNFGTDANTVLEGNKLAEMLGGTYAGSLNNSNQKKVDSIYYDSTTKQFYKCIKAGTVNYADASYFTSVSMKSLSDRLDNLIKVEKINVIDSFTNSTSAYLTKIGNICMLRIDTGSAIKNNTTLIGKVMQLNEKYSKYYPSSLISVCAGTYSDGQFATFSLNTNGNISINRGVVSKDAYYITFVYSVDI